MSVTTKDVMKLFGVSREQVRQQGSKQLFVVDTNNLGKVLVSYYTIVGRFTGSEWLLTTTTKYSVTTSKQINQFARSTSYPVKFVDDINAPEF